MSTLAEAPRSILAPGAIIPRHVHAAAYATVVLDGGYQEAGECGRWHVQAGDVLLHAPFSAHWDQVPGRGARVVNLPLPLSLQRSTCGQVDDLDLVVRLAEHDPGAAAAALVQGWRHGRAGLTDAPDLLAEALSAPSSVGVRAWSDAHGVSRATAFRWFRAAYGVGPARYRTEARARLAWHMLVHGTASLAEIAAAVGYADQAHMTRGIQAFTGRSPGAWRACSASATFVQDRRRRR